MNKMTKFWLATASLLYPSISSERLVTLDQIRQKHLEMFGEELAPSLEQQLISWKRRYADKKNLSRGGSRNRYLFRTEDAHTPSPIGKFRLYKLSDSEHDGVDKTGPACPESENVQENLRYLIVWYLERYKGASAEFDTDALEVAAEIEIQESDLPPTEKQSLINSRRGQGIFKTRVAEIESGCRLTGVTDIRFLVASHIKPWAVSTNAERLDGNNGLLLAPHADRLFDKGFITFEQDGTMVISPEASEVCQCWKLTKAIGKPLSQKQEEFMRHHRKHIFGKWTTFWAGS